MLPPPIPVPIGDNGSGTGEGGAAIERGKSRFYSASGWTSQQEIADLSQQKKKKQRGWLVSVGSECPMWIKAFGHERMGSSS